MIYQLIAAYVFLGAVSVGLLLALAVIGAVVTLIWAIIRSELRR